MNTSNKTLKVFSEIGIFAAIGYVLDELQGAISKLIPSLGGSIGFAMIAVLIIALRRGLWPALLTGLIMGVLDVATGAYIVHPVQPFLDYIFPYCMVAFAALLKPFYDKEETKGKKILILILMTVLGGFLKFVSHYLSGVIFFADPNYFVWGLNDLSPYLYSFIYNIAFIGPSIILTAILLVAIYLKAPFILTAKDEEVEEKKEVKKSIPLSISSVVMSGGLFLFTFFLIRYIKSYYIEDWGSSYEYSLNADSMVICILGLMLILIASYGYISIFKNNYSKNKFVQLFLIVCLICLVYGVAMLIRSYIKNKPVQDYWIWSIISLAVSSIVGAYALIINRKEN